MQNLVATLLKAAYGEDASVGTIDVEINGEDLVFLVGPRAEGPAAYSASYVQKVLHRLSAS
jgi:hypothetical protein